MTAATSPTRADQLARADDRRAQIFKLIGEFITEGSGPNYHGYPPTVSELAALTGVSNRQVRVDLATLEDAGLIERDPGQPRAIRIVNPSTTPIDA